MTRAGARPRALDLFAGAAGGWTLGLHRAGFQTVAMCEIDPWRRSRYAENFPDVRLYADIRCLTAARLAADGIAPPWIVCGSPPCQDASAANTRGRGVDGERTGLYREWLRLVSELRPAWTAIENSPRLRTRGADRLLVELESLDYAVWPLVVSAGDIGAPHARERVWIVAADARADRQFQQSRRFKEERRRPGHRALFNDHDAARLGCERGRPAKATGRPWPEFARDDPRNGAHPDRARPEIGQGERGDDCPELPPALRAWACGWPHWNGGLAGLAAAVAAERAGDLPHGLSARLSARERNRRIAAIGDSIVPQIAEAIGRAILATEAA